MNDLKIPLHVSIIPDGNRRWAVSNGLTKVSGYSKVDYEHLESLLLEAKKLGVKYISLWIFSTENWKRPKIEIDFLFNHFLKNVDKFLNGALNNEVRVRHLGRKDRLPKKVVDALEMLEYETVKFNDFNVLLCMDYGGRDEIVRAFNKVLKSGVSELDDESLKNYMDSAGIPDPDLVIRTSGEKRLSGFMPYQSVYSEFYFTDIHFPDFTSENLREAVENFAKRKRRFGND